MPSLSYAVRTGFSSSYDDSGSSETLYLPEAEPCFPDIGVAGCYRRERQHLPLETLGRTRCEGLTHCLSFLNLNVGRVVYADAWAMAFGCSGLLQRGQAKARSATSADARLPSSLVGTVKESSTSTKLKIHPAYVGESACQQRLEKDR